jgi:hypothetical protein
VALKKKRKERKERREELEMSRLRRRNAPKPLREELVRAVRRLGRKVERDRDETMSEDEEGLEKWLEREKERKKKKKERERERKKMERWNRKKKLG